MRSASSSTSVLSAERSRLPRSKWSMMRPGVPTTMCAPCSRLAICPRSATPPQSVTTLMFSAARQAPDFGRDLVGQLARRAQHHRLDGEAACVKVGEQREGKGGGLAAAGLGLGDQVLAEQRRRQAGRLDRRHLRVAELREVGQHLGRERQRGKAVVGCGAAGCGIGCGHRSTAGTREKQGPCGTLRGVPQGPSSVADQRRGALLLPELVGGGPRRSRWRKVIRPLVRS